MDHDRPVWKHFAPNPNKQNQLFWSISFSA